MLPLHLRINDAATAKPTAVRLRITGPQGEYYPPLGRLAAFSSGRGEAVGGNLRLQKENWAYIDGACEISLPSGVPLRIQATKGPLYTPLDETVTLGVGKLALRFEIAKAIDTPWICVDSRVHSIDPFTALLEAAAEDVAVTHLLARSQFYLGQDGNTFESVPNIAAFSGQVAALDREGRSLFVNTLNTHHALGKFALLNSHRPVFPLAFGGNYGSDDWSLLDWCRQCHRKNGLTVWVDAFRPEGGLPGGEALVAAILGEIDAIEIDAQPRREPLLPWIYRLWNAGVLMPLVGGSGKDSNAIALGAMRTFLKTNEETDAITAMRAGKSFVTNGPILEINANDAGPGESLDVAAVEDAVSITATCRNLAPFDKLEIVADGQVIAVAMPQQHRADVSITHAFKTSGWLGARVVGANGAFAHSSPIRVTVAGQPLPRRRMFLPLLRQAIEKTREWAVERGQYTDEKWRTQLVANCDAATAKLTATDSIIESS